VTGPQLLKKLPTFYGIRRFITVFTRACPSWARSVSPWLPPFFKIHFNIILSSMPGYSKPVTLPQIYLPKPCMHLFSPSYMLDALHISVFLILSPEWYLVRNTENKAPCYVVFSKTLSLRLSLNASDQVSQPRKTTNKIIILCILIFTFLDSKREDKKILHWMTVSISWLQFALNFFMNGILIC
jgi:hypothetical protein